MIKIVLILLVVVVCFMVFRGMNLGVVESDSDNPSGGQLWVMIEIDDYFRSNSDLAIEEDLIALVERLGLGEVDGHSSGAHQFDFNFYDVSNYDKAKEEISNLIDKKYPKVNYVISSDYAMPFEKTNS